MKTVSTLDSKWANWVSFFFAALALLAPEFAYPASQVSPPPPGNDSGNPVEFQEKPPLILGLGEQRLLRIPGLARFSLGSPVIRAHPLPAALEGARDALLLRGNQAGTSDIWVWKSDAPPEHRKVRVEKTSPQDLSPPLEKALSGLQEAEILIAGSEVLVRGEIQSASEAGRVAAIAQAFPKEIRDETTLGEALLSRERAKLESWIARSPYQGRVRIENRNGALVASGSIESAAERESLLKRLRAIFSAIQFEIQALPDDNPTVHFKVFLLELKKNRFRDLGLSWPMAAPGAFRVTTSGVQDLLQLDLTLEAFESDGSARILSNPELVVRAPGEAELFSGGELPIHTESHFYSNVSWKTFGLTLKLKVTHVTGEKIRLEIFTEVSHLDPTIAEDKIPGLQANRMKTQVDARFGKPILLSGLLQQNLRQTAQGLPWLKQIPVLGKLFGSEDYLNEKSELVAILLPSANPPEPPMERVLPPPPPPGFALQPMPEPLPENLKEEHAR